eukprot:10826991-Heterocapsa_arctica.AAC.1
MTHAQFTQGQIFWDNMALMVQDMALLKNLNTAALTLAAKRTGASDPLAAGRSSHPPGARPATRTT